MILRFLRCSKHGKFQWAHVFHFLRVGGLAGVLEKADEFETGSSRCKRRLLVAILRLLLQAQLYFRIYPERESIILYMCSPGTMLYP